jgi:hypothetical protein
VGSGLLVYRFEALSQTPGAFPLRRPRGAVPEGQRSAAVVSNEWTRLDSADDGRQILLEGNEVFAAEQNSRPAALSGLHHQDLVDVHQDLS